MHAQTSGTAVYNTNDPTVGISGRLQAFMSTSFAFADNSFFASNNSPDPVTVLSKLQPQHMRILMTPGAAPMTSATSWDFSILNAVLPKLTNIGDRNPEFAVYSAPAWMNAGGVLASNHVDDYANYCANLVRYINLGGFVDSAGISHTAPAGLPRITWWSIYNEPDEPPTNGISGQQYAAIYNKVVTAMKSVDPTIKIVAGELSYFLPNYPFVADFVSNVTASVDAFAIHHYPIGCANQGLNDDGVMADAPNFLWISKGQRGHSIDASTESRTAGRTGLADGE